MAMKFLPRSLKSDLTVFLRPVKSPSLHGKRRQEARGNPPPRTDCGHSFGASA